MAEAAVKHSRLSVVAELAQRLMIGFVPEEIAVAAMWVAMIDASCLNWSRMKLERIAAEWILTQKMDSVLSPAEAVAAFGCRSPARCCATLRATGIAKSARLNQIWAKRS